MKARITFILIVLFNFCYAQKTIIRYFNGEYIVPDSSVATHYLEIPKPPLELKEGVLISRFVKNDSIHSTVLVKETKKNGKYQEFYLKGSAKEISNYKDDRKLGVAKHWYENGKPSYISDWKYFEKEIPEKVEKGDFSFLPLHFESFVSVWDTNGKMILRNGTGTCKFYYDNGVLKERGKCYKGLKIGSWTGYDEFGKRAYVEMFDTVSDITKSGRITKSVLKNGMYVDEGGGVIQYKEPLVEASTKTNFDDWFKKVMSELFDCCVNLRRVNGYLFLTIFITDEGKPFQVTVSENHKELRRCAYKIIMRNGDFNPALLRGKPVYSTLRFPIRIRSGYDNIDY